MSRRGSGASAIESLASALGGSKRQTTNFKIDTADYLGMKHEAYKTKLFQLAIVSPKDYFKIREQVLEKVKTQAVETQYEVYYNLLTMGEDPDGIPYVSGSGDTPGVGSLRDYFYPSVPLQECNQFALKASKTIDAICEEAVEMLIPMNYKEIAEKRLAKRTEGNLGF